MAREDFDGAVTIYQALNENVVVEDGFLGNLTSAGLSGPFDEDFYKTIAEIIAGRA